ncbi:NAD(P)/FAD-dependent oxidoreductase [Glycomyces terrestris]|uniref:FAD-dependent oxidoreductase n=1 Tax=Glycomyces terrestris TaxID=2493553 RepID=A0A426UT42_9ACTN|nr:FAD-binding oxidoreductase [Glycomyces terrestris]RRR96846.1 FAD-dependent oxidoreductase [Glycomyces terrestris]
MNADVVVIGAGIVGAACARALARAGLSVIVVDCGAPASATSARGEGNLLVSDKAPGPELDLALLASAHWPLLAAELADELSGDQGSSPHGGFPDIEYDRKGGIVVATTDAGAEPLRAFARSQAAVGVEIEQLTPADALSLEPHLNPAITAAVHYPQDAQLQPVVATEALLASARRAGVRVLANQEVVGAVRSGGRITGVRTTSGTIGAGAVVVAAGPWSGQVAAVLGADLPVRPRRGMVLVTARMPQRVFHKVYDGDYFGATQSADADLQTSSVVESTPGGTVLIGSSRQQIGFDDRLRVEVLAQVARRALRLFPFLEGTPVIRAYGGFRPYVPDHLPVIGEDHRDPGLWYATGHEGAGIGLAGVTGDLLCAQLTGTTPALDPAPFLPSRPSLAAHLKTDDAGPEADRSTPPRPQVEASAQRRPEADSLARSRPETGAFVQTRPEADSPARYRPEAADARSRSEMAADALSRGTVADSRSGGAGIETDVPAPPLPGPEASVQTRPEADRSTSYRPDAADGRSTAVRSADALNGGTA